MHLYTGDLYSTKQRVALFLKLRKSKFGDFDSLVWLDSVLLPCQDSKTTYVVSKVVFLKMTKITIRVLGNKTTDFGRI